jgi:hypothetical protein
MRPDTRWTANEGVTGNQLYPGRIEDITGARSGLEEEGAVSVSLLCLHVVLQTKSARNLDSSSWRSVNTTMSDAPPPYTRVTTP